MHLLKEKKTYVHNSADTIEKTVDKVRTTGILEVNGIYSPETIVLFNGDSGKYLTNKKNRYLLKPIFGSQGKEIILVKNIKKELIKILKTEGVKNLKDIVGGAN